MGCCRFSGPRDHPWIIDRKVTQRDFDLRSSASKGSTVGCAPGLLLNLGDVVRVVCIFECTINDVPGLERARDARCTVSASRSLELADRNLAGHKRAADGIKSIRMAPGSEGRCSAMHIIIRPGAGRPHGYLIPWPIHRTPALNLFPQSRRIHLTTITLIERQQGGLHLKSSCSRFIRSQCRPLQHVSAFVVYHQDQQSRREQNHDKTANRAEMSGRGTLSIVC